MPERPVDPELAAAIRRVRQLSRRRFIVRGGLGLGGLVLAPSMLTACGDDDAGGGGGDSGGESGGDGGATAGDGDTAVTISNWDAYIDEDAQGSVDGAGTSIADFEAETGIEVTYRKDFNDNDDYFNRIYSPVLGRGQRIDADITCPSYWMAARIINLGWTEELPLDQIPNHKNLEDVYLDLEWDPGAKHFMPWQAGITGIAYNPALTGRELTSCNDLWDPEFSGKVGMLTEMRDSVGLTMYGQGADPSVNDQDAIDAAIAKIAEATDSGQILKFFGNEYLRSLESGELTVCVAWSGDIAQIDPDLGIEFVIPEEGGLQWFDTMTIAKGAANVPAAAAWMNYVYDPEHAAKITEWVQYVSPVKGVREALEAKGGDAAALAESTLLFPDDAALSNLKVFAELEQEQEIDIASRFNDITG